MAVNYKPYPYTTEPSDKFLKADGTWGDNNELVSTIEENELVTAAALADLDSRINDLKDISANSESLTWTELKNLRDNYELVPGKYYRIYDYMTTTGQTNTQSAGHQFDVIVLALSENSLSETAYAAYSDEDSYFEDAGANLNAWELKYCLDNDADRFAWAVAGGQITPDDVYDAGFRGCYLVECDYYNGELAVYRNYRNPEQGEENYVNDEPFVYKGQIDYDGSTYYAWQKVDYNDYVKMILTDTLYSVGQIQEDEPVAVLMVDYDDIVGGETGNGKGVIYYMKDEWDNECPYDFKNIQFKRKITDGSLDTQSGTDTWLYTFTWIDENDNVQDASIFAQNIGDELGCVRGVWGNSIQPAIAAQFDVQSNNLEFMLNDNVFISRDSRDPGFFYGIYANVSV